MARLQEILALLGDWPFADVPAALFPVRLETRFVPVGGGNVELRLRIFPDDIHIDTFEPGLTDDEAEAGQLYWQALWAGGEDAAHREIAWRRLAERFDPPRAAWIVRALTPANLEQLGTGQPEFPDHPRQEEAWTRPALVRLMPDRWVACGYLEGERVLLEAGEPIRPDLAASPAPDAAEAPEPGEPPDEQSDLPLDEGMRWLVDFDQAVAQGMAIRATLTEHDAEHGFDRLVVLGLRGTGEEAGALADLLDAQRYTDGLAFLPQGTRTNNTAASRAGSTSADAERVLAAATGAPLIAVGDASNGDVTARALGIGADIFAHVPRADDRERAEAAAMNCAMWQAGWGTYLRELVTAGEQHSFHPEARAYFEAFVHGRGPLPTLQIGAQPYGLLPVLPLARWTAGEDDLVETALHPALSLLRERWASEIERVPRVGRFDQLDAARDDFLRALSTDAVSMGFRARPLLASQLFGIPGVPGFNFDFPGGTIERWNEAQRIGGELGLASIRRFGRLLLTGHDFVLSGPLVQIDLTSNDLSPNYLRWLAEQPWQAIFDEDFSALGEGFDPRALLYLALRYAVLVEYAYAAGRIRIANGDLTEIDVHEPDVHDPGGTVTRPTRAMLADGRAPALGEGPLKDFIHTLDGSASPELAPVDRLRESLRTLSALPPARLDRLFRESVDLCSHRLDAWITSFAARRLERMRQAKPKGIVIGGYGWLESVRMERTREPAEAPPGEDGPLFVDPRNAGFVAAPSMTHAATAAVLRSGWLSQPDPGNPLAVDLSSRRVRLARWLLDSVRQGQPLAALLGYRFERALQDRGLARYIAPFRRVSPFGAILAAEREVARLQAEVAGHPPGTPEREAAEARLAEAQAHHAALLQQRREKFLFPTDADVEAMEAVEERIVVDGLALREMWIAGAVPFGRSGLPDETGADRTSVEAVLADLDDAVDAVADAVTAESVYHTVAGNPLKVGATLAAVAAGEAPPPELEIARTPRSGFGIEHLLMILFSGPVPDAPAWPGTGTQPRARAEPLLERWAARLLGDPARVRLVADWRRPGVADPGASQELRLSDLPFSALDLVHGVRGHEEPESSTAAAMALYHMGRNRPAGVPAEALPTLVLARGDDWPATDLGLAEIAEMARAVHAVLSDARPLEPADLAGPDMAGRGDIAVAEVEVRANAAATSLATDAAALEALLATASPDAGALRDAMLSLSFYGIDSAVPESAVGADPATLAALKEQGVGVSAAATARLGELEALANALPAGATAEDRRNNAVARVRAIFGNDFAILTRIDPPSATELAQSFAASTALQDGDPTAAHTWLRRAARVREPVERLETLLDFAECLTNLTDERVGLDLTVAQLPHRPGDRWLGLPLGPQGTPESGAVSLVAHLASPFRPDAQVAGLVVDRWVDVIPAPRQHAALTFNFDAPGSRPPQAVLLAVPPGREERWDFETVEATVHEALDLAKLRAVDPSLLQRLDGYDHFLPATVFALNLDEGETPGGVTISADLMRAAEVAADPAPDL